MCEAKAAKVQAQRNTVVNVIERWSCGLIVQKTVRRQRY